MESLKTQTDSVREESFNLKLETKKYDKVMSAYSRKYYLPNKIT